jgi:N-acetyl-gamma-glutamyl-phosphate reductase
MIQAGIIGGAGYTAGELIRLLLLHPEANIAFVQSNSCNGKYIEEVHRDLVGETTLMFNNGNTKDVDVLFLCMGHGKSKQYLKDHPVSSRIKVIDLSQDFRTDNSFIYGLPELNKTHYTSRIANPGCFATAIQLGLLPLASKGLLSGDVHVNGITGSTGAGQNLSATTHFSWRNGNVSVYKPFVHQHLNEINHTLAGLNSDTQLQFIPVRGPFTRGIFATLYTECDLDGEQVEELYTSFYEQEPFTTVVKAPPDLKQVLNTNKCMVHVEKHENKVFVTTVLDNLLKGASGQAVQNMNILFGLTEGKGLKLKSSYF